MSFTQVDVGSFRNAQIRLVGFDSGVPHDALRSAMRLHGHWKENVYGGSFDYFDAYAWEGIVGLIINGERHDWILRVDPDDGYRSHLAPVLAAPVHAAVMQFRHDPILVRLEEYPGNADGWRLLDADGHAWLEFGTDNLDDYYPSGFVRWTPKEA